MRMTSISMNSRLKFVILGLSLLIIAFVVVWFTSVRTKSNSPTSPFDSNISSMNITNILAFGDSMTKGLSTKRAYYPYSTSLVKTLSQHNSSHGAFVVDTRGVNGDTAIGTSKARLATDLGEKKYDWVILLFGTNDLMHLFNGRGIGASISVVNKVFSKLVELCQFAQGGYGSKVIIGTLTARPCEEGVKFVCDSFAKNRQLLNAKIRLYASESDWPLLADFDKRLNYTKMDEITKQKYWADHVHLTKVGYEVMADVIYQTMKIYL